jgi:hypothetical protein
MTQHEGLLPCSELDGTRSEVGPFQWGPGGGNWKTADRPGHPNRRATRRLPGSAEREVGAPGKWFFLKRCVAGFAC